MQKDRTKYWSLPTATAMQHFYSGINGLTSENAALRLKENGDNSIKEQKKTSQLMMFFNQFKNPIVIILIIATGISLVTGELIDASIIFLIVLASSVLSFLHEYSASNALEELREKVQVKSLVMRDGKLIEIPSRELVVGDIIQLSAGSLVPADGLILESLDLSVNQSILTGESLPTEKNSGVVSEDVGVIERTNCVFMGTNVQNGSARVLIVETGENTEFG
ncbi:MAG: HAD-IC family P-type ATPase, partial [Peptococcaceae bacterium]|nr:HAD-IC family P-type ATPase [Peptococcaceae bacterium]